MSAASGKDQTREVLPGSRWFPVVTACLGAFHLVGELLTDRRAHWVALGVVLVLQGTYLALTRNTVLSDDGIEPTGWLGRRVSWTDVFSVEPRPMGWIVPPGVQVRVRRRRRPVFIEERRQGRDLAAIAERWQRSRQPV